MGYYCNFSTPRVAKSKGETGYINSTTSKGHSISKADYHALDSPKKQTDEFDLFAVKRKKANKSNPSVRFLGESMVRQSAFEIN